MVILTVNESNRIILLGISSVARKQVVERASEIEMEIEQGNVD
jgi:hypothetical protein